MILDFVSIDFAAVNLLGSQIVTLELHVPTANF